MHTHTAVNDTTTTGFEKGSCAGRLAGSAGRVPSSVASMCAASVAGKQLASPLGARNSTQSSLLHVHRPVGAVGSSGSMHTAGGKQPPHGRHVIGLSPVPQGTQGASGLFWTAWWYPLEHPHTYVLFTTAQPTSGSVLATTHGHTSQVPSSATQRGGDPTTHSGGQSHAAVVALHRRGKSQGGSQSAGTATVQGEARSDGWLCVQPTAQPHTGCWAITSHVHHPVVGVPHHNKHGSQVGPTNPRAHVLQAGGCAHPASHTQP